MFAAIILGLITGAIVGLVVCFICLKLADVFQRIKKYVSGKVAMGRVKKMLGEAIEEETKNGNTIKLSELMKANEALTEQYGENSIIEAHVLDNGKIDTDSIKILKSETEETDVTNMFNDNDGLLIIDPAC